MANGKLKVAKYTERERDFIDMCAIHLMAALWSDPELPEVMNPPEAAFDGAERLLAERRKRI